MTGHKQRKKVGTVE